MQSPSQLLLQKFPFEPTEGQFRLFQYLDIFLLDKENEYQAFLLRGYAGTGKTTVLSRLVKIASRFNYRAHMMAPTGRAAKVMSSYSQRNAFTIHKTIYQQTADSYTGLLSFKRQKNYYKNTLFIVDEASMVQNEPDNMGNGLLRDLVAFVFEDSSNKLLIVGDSAQLPPVNQNISPALDANYLRDTFGLNLLEHELTEVVRQQQESGILRNATMLRQHINRRDFNIEFQTKGYRDIFKMSGDRLPDGLEYAYSKYGHENVAIICRSNKQAVQYNKFIRTSILGRESELDAGDLIMIVRNNYTWLDETAPAGFLANGDFAEVLRVRQIEEMHGFRFATLRLRLLDYPDQEPFEAKVLLDTLHSEQPNLSQADNRLLYESVCADYSDVENKRSRNEQIRIDPYLNALQVKFAYALTCHKSQGGQWKAVFVEQGYLNDDMINVEFLRWLYTAITRAESELFLMNFAERFFK
ncbi:exodeoxyribonuclease-5 [Flexibacter flexilis DSM 6793]|uniref:Exodeoxyribonuclease-5 n=1 Tax=Flexibacter flexilis DSM 6793 TaxID=927664 RepID=A0A1I1GYI7_9BACT|nr:AAA family ATPase [Flexibacter flexilis]SFC16734.1 exodeoxyribonuclease-5 [Flexibacter flexilis DSM 6793]